MGGGGCKGQVEDRGAMSIQYFDRSIEIGSQAKMEALRAHVLVVGLSGRAWLVPASAVGLATLGAFP